MSITAKCTIEHGMIKLPSSLGLADGMRVLINIEPLAAKTSKKRIAQDLAGSWNCDGSIDKLFAEIEADRHSYFGRDAEMKA